MTFEIVEDRRQEARIAPPKPCWRISLLLFSDRMAKSLFASKAGLSVFLLLFSLCVSAIIWSIYYRLPTIDQSSSLIHQLTRLEIQLEDLQVDWSEDDLKRIESDISQEQAKIFADFPTFAAWLNGKNEYAGQLGLDMNYQLNDQHRTRLDGIVSVGLKINLKVKPEIADRAYIRLLEFMRSLIDENRHLEIAGNELRSDGKGVNMMSLEIVVWLKDEKAIGESMVVESDVGAEEDSDVAYIEE